MSDLWRLFAVLAVSGATLVVGACGSRVVDERTSPVGIAWAAESTPSPQQDSDSAATPYESVSSEAVAARRTLAVTEPPTATPHTVPGQSPPDTPPPREQKRCDWHANLNRAAAGRTADWIVQDTGAWGRAEVPGRRIWIAPRTPCGKVYSVAVHEWTHHMQGVVYRDWGAVVRELAPYGGPEIVADCGALILGATWIRYGCPGGSSNAAAAAILRGELAAP